MSLSDRDGQSFFRKLSIGMRIVKTVISIFISIMITIAINGQPTNSAIAAFICTRSNDRDAVNTGRDRIRGTVIGGIFSAIFVLIIEYFQVKLFTPSYYLMMSLLLIPIIKTTIWINLPDATTNACIVALITLLSYVKETNAYTHVLNRVIDTMIGVSVAIVINKLLPYKKNIKDEDQGEKNKEKN